MDNNWLMMALQSPEGMNFLNMWRQKQGISSASGAPSNTFGNGSTTPVSRWRSPTVGAGGSAASALSPGGIGSSPVMPQTQTATPSFGGGISRMPQMSQVGGGSNDFSQQAGMMPFYQNGN